MEDVMGAEGGYFMREHSLVAPYQGKYIHNATFIHTVHCPVPRATGGGMDIPYWEFGGASVVTNSYIRLTPDRQSKNGNLWNTAVRSSTCRIMNCDAVFLISQCVSTIGRC